LVPLFWPYIDDWNGRGIFIQQFDIVVDSKESFDGSLVINSVVTEQSVVHGILLDDFCRGTEIVLFEFLNRLGEFIELGLQVSGGMISNRFESFLPDFVAAPVGCMPSDLTEDLPFPFRK